MKENKSINELFETDLLLKELNEIHDKFHKIANDFIEADQTEEARALAREEATEYIEDLLNREYPDDKYEINVMKTVLIRTKGTKDADNEVARIRKRVKERYDELSKILGH